MSELLIDPRTDRPPGSLKQKDDIVCVRSDGFNWSESELPKVRKFPGLKYEDAVKYEQNDSEIFIRPKIELSDFKTKEERNLIIAIGKIAIDKEISDFKKSITRVRVYSEITGEGTITDLETEHLQKARNQLNGNNYDFFVTADGKEYPCSVDVRDVTYAHRRYAVKNGKIFDKVEQKEVNP